VPYIVTIAHTDGYYCRHQPRFKDSDLGKLLFVTKLGAVEARYMLDRLALMWVLAQEHGVGTVADGSYEEAAWLPKGHFRDGGSDGVWERLVREDSPHPAYTTSGGQVKLIWILNDGQMKHVFPRGTGLSLWPYGITTPATSPGSWQFRLPTYAPGDKPYAIYRADSHFQSSGLLGEVFQTVLERCEKE